MGTDRSLEKTDSKSTSLQLKGKNSPLESQVENYHPLTQAINRLGNTGSVSNDAAILQRAPFLAQHSLLQLQKQYGNYYVQRVITEAQQGIGVVQRKCACGTTSGSTGGCAACERKHQLSSMFQAKLQINQPGDPFEREANRVAEQIMHMPNSALQRQRDDKHLQTKPLVQQQVAGNGGGSEAPPIVHEVLRSPGQPLDPGTRAFMESRFGHDFSQVRIHSDRKAAESARSVDALAYTVGQNLVFSPGQYEPKTIKGKKLLAHELTHTIQQGQTFDFSDLALDAPNTSFEQEATHNASHLYPKRVSALPTTMKTTGTLQRELLAYKREHTEILPSYGETSSVSSIVYTADAADIRNALEALITDGKILATDDGQRIFFANQSASHTEIESALSKAGYSSASDMADALLDNHNVFVYSNERLIRISTLFGTSTLGRRTQVLERQTERLLTNYEKNEARLVFGSSLDFHQVTLAEDPVLSVGGYARTLPRTIYFPPGSFGSSNFMPWLIHELTHSWQYQHGVSIFTTIYHALKADYDYGGEAGLITAQGEGRHFRDFTTEEQGDILKDYYVRLKNGQDTSAWLPFVTEVQNS